MEARENQPTTNKFLDSVKKGWKEFADPFVALTRAPRALWGVILSYFLEGAAYFGILIELTIYLQENVGLNEHHSSLVVGFFTGFITLFQMVLGMVADKIGVRRALWLATCVLLLGRASLSLGGHLFTGTGLWSAWFFLSAGSLLVVALGYAMYQPAAYAAVRQFTDEKGAAMGYAMIYGVMNLGGFCAGLLSPSIRRATTQALPPNGVTAVLWVCTGAVALGMLVLLLLLTRRSVERGTVVRAAAPAKAAPGKEDPGAAVLWDPLFVAAFLLALLGFVFLLDQVVGQPLEAVFGFTTTGNPKLDLIVRVAVFLLLLSPAVALFLRRRPDHPFRNSRFAFFIFVLIPVQTLFAHQWLTLPKYVKYAFSGFVSENYEIITNLNSVLIFVLAPLVAALTSRANVYRMMIAGTLVMAAPTFLLVLGPQPVFLYAYITLMTIGEAMWQPRFLQYIAEVAPEGKTGIYMGIGQFPWVLTKWITSFYAGWFLARYCPQGGEQQTESMWLIYACIAMISPILLFSLRKWAQGGSGEVKNGSV